VFVERYANRVIKRSRAAREEEKENSTPQTDYSHVTEFFWTSDILTRFPTPQKIADLWH
tara:strand:+ start:254 stop:430 length:177 start_codon:yes stop_codon:yes gene_type:complete